MGRPSARTAALIVASAAVGASCFVSPVPGERTGSSAAAIVGGQPDPSDVAVVAVVRKSSGALCSGTVVAPTVVLTAAHCVFQLPASDLQVLVGDSTMAPDQTLAVSAAVAYPTYDDETDGIPGGVDLGAVILAQPISVQPVAVDTTTTDSQLEAAPVTVVGYGLASSGNDTTAGTRREVSLAAAGVCSRVLTGGTSTSNACLGDSGGAVLLGGALVAVVSGGTPDCSGPTTFTRTDAHATWLASVLAGDPTAACPTCVPPDPSCGAATETAAAMSADAGDDASAAAGAPATKGSSSRGGCATAPGASRPEGSLALVAGALLGLARRRRSRTR